MLRRYYAMDAGKTNQKYRRDQDEYMAKKLGTAKPTINIKTPESYVFYKTKFKKYKNKDTLCNLNFLLI